MQKTEVWYFTVQTEQARSIIGLLYGWTESACEHMLFARKIGYRQFHWVTIYGRHACSIKNNFVLQVKHNWKIKKQKFFSGLQSKNFPPDKRHPGRRSRYGKYGPRSGYGFLLTACQPIRIENFERPYNTFLYYPARRVRPRLHDETGTKSNRNENWNCQHVYMRPVRKS
jgi:hypothetical protein